MPQPPIIAEIAAHTPEAASAAQAGGAHRVELFSSPMGGGVTPSEGAIAIARDKLTIDLHILVRPRAGDFLYSDEEIQLMLWDISAAKRLGANGVVFGVVNQDGSVDVERARELVAASRPMAVTFHRAFDACKDLSLALNDLIACGVDRVLTSGGERSAMDGIKTIADLARIGGDRIIVMAAGGIRPENVRSIVEGSGVREIHAGLRSVGPSAMRYKNDKLSFGSGGDEYERLVVREHDVRDLIEQVNGL
jgi:copper homeostasis protein